MAHHLPVLIDTASLPLASAEDEARSLRVGDLAQRTGKTVRALHLYEELGLLRPSGRSKGGYRLYGVDAVTRVRWITKLQELNFSLPEAREVLHDWEQSGSAPKAMTKLRALYRSKLKETLEQLERLTTLKHELTATVNYLETCETCDPERLVHACARCDQHGCRAPELVSGLHAQG
jgi:DNA-binding transcriptional MerR regulator